MLGLLYIWHNKSIAYIQRALIFGRGVLYTWKTVSARSFRTPSPTCAMHRSSVVYKVIMTKFCIISVILPLGSDRGQNSNTDAFIINILLFF